MSARLKKNLVLVIAIIVVAAVAIGVFLYLRHGSSPAPSAATNSLNPLSSGRLKVSSFNIEHLSHKSRTEGELRMIAHILKEFDLIAVQELHDEIVIKDLVQIGRASCRERVCQYV